MVRPFWTVFDYKFQHRRELVLSGPQQVQIAPEKPRPRLGTETGVLTTSGVGSGCRLCNDTSNAEPSSVVHVTLVFKIARDELRRPPRSATPAIASPGCQSASTTNRNGSLRSRVRCEPQAVTGRGSCSRGSRSCMRCTGSLSRRSAIQTTRHWRRSGAWKRPEMTDRTHHQGAGRGNLT